MTFHLVSEAEKQDIKGKKNKFDRLIARFVPHVTMYNEKVVIRPLPAPRAFSRISNFHPFNPGRMIQSNTERGVRQDRI